MKSAKIKPGSMGLAEVAKNYPEAFRTIGVEGKVNCPFLEECHECAEPTNFPECDKYLSKVGYINSGEITI